MTPHFGGFMMDTNCPISKAIYQFLPGACVKMRSIFKSHSLKIATYASMSLCFLEPRKVNRQQTQTVRVSGHNLSSMLP